MSEPLWFILRHPLPAFPNARNSAQHTVDSFNRWENARLELFAPTIVSESITNGKRVERERPLLFNYVFIRGTFGQVKDLCTRDNGFSFVIDSRDALIEGTERYATLSDAQMEAFKRIAFANRNRLSVVSLEDVDLQQGDEVEVVEGPFTGLKGTFMPRTKSTSGNILLQATSASAVALFDIKAKYIRVLRFAPGSKRAYDQIDAFLPPLFDALRAYAALIPLTTRQITRLTAFVRRFGATRIDAPKTHAKLQLLLQAANAILGNSKLPPPYNILTISRLQQPTLTREPYSSFLPQPSANSEAYAPGGNPTVRLRK